MPELPEVECIRRTLEPLIAGRAVLDVTLRRRDIVVAPGDPAGGFSRQRARRPARPKPLAPPDLLVGMTVARIERRGKQLAIIGRSRERGEAVALGVQLGMTGGLRFSPKDTGDRHVHAVWRFEHGLLSFHDPRRFGGLRVFPSIAALREHWAALGPDALTISASDLASALAGSRRATKVVLMDQSAIAGVGNIYADESLFHAGVHPARLASRLHDTEIERLAGEIRAVLEQSVATGGTTLRDYTDAQGRRGGFQERHAVYGRVGCPCVVCRAVLRSRSIGQRTTVWCPSCQPWRSPRVR